MFHVLCLTALAEPLNPTPALEVAARFPIVADVTGDGTADVLSIPYPETRFHVHFGDNGLTATADQVLEADLHTTDPLVVDFNGDGAADVLGERVYGYYPGSSAGVVSEPQTFEGSGWRNLRLYAVGDANADGYADVLTRASEEAAQFWFGGTGEPTNATEVSVGGSWSNSESWTSSTVDLTGDGNADFLRVVGTGVGIFAADSDQPTDESWDGGDSAGEVTWFKASFDGFQSVVAPSVGGSYAVAATGDFTGDGHGDLVLCVPNADAAGENSGAAYLYEGLASGGVDGNHSLSWEGEAGQKMGCACIDGDFNGDGATDLAIGSDGEAGRIDIVLGGAMSEGIVQTLTRPGPYGAIGCRIQAGDVDGDGADDLLVYYHANDDAFWEVYSGVPAPSSADSGEEGDGGGGCGCSGAGHGGGSVVLLSGLVTMLVRRRDGGLRKELGAIGE